MDINASKMQDDTQPQGAAAAGESAQGAANKQGRTPSKIVENAFFCYSTPETIKGGASAGQTQTVEAALAVFPKSHESFLRAASSLPLKLRGWWKVRTKFARRTGPLWEFWSFLLWAFWFLSTKPHRAHALGVDETTSNSPFSLLKN